MSDKIEKIGKSLIQHGKYNDRIYLMKLNRDDFPEIINQIDVLAKTYDYSKIFVKVPSWAKQRFEVSGYKTEAYIPNFYNGTDDAFFMAKYLNPVREIKSDNELINKIIATAQNIEPINAADLYLKDNLKYDLLTQNDVRELAEVYKKVFETYPFPIHDPAYLIKTMNDNVVYFGIWDNDTLIAVSSCEMNIADRNVEMTDFATLPEYRSKGLASYLLMKMENEMLERGMITAYTIARAASYGMNITFAKHRYIYTGTLINNTNIFGGIESMNVWYKTLKFQK